MAIIADGKKISSDIIQKVKHEVGILKKKGVCPKLAVVLVGKDKPSLSYVKKKEDACGEAEIDFSLYRYPENIKTGVLAEEIERIQKKDCLSGLIVQLPLGKKIDQNIVLNKINPELDVDFLTNESLGQLVRGSNKLMPPTSAAIMEVIRYYKIDIINKHAVIIGRGGLVGKPLANIFMNMQLTVSVCHKELRNINEFTKSADVIITGAGVRGLVKGRMIKENAVVIDAGVCFVEGVMYGDMDFDSVEKKAGLVTPTPGGVGPITVAKLLENVVLNAKLIKK